MFWVKVKLPYRINFTGRIKMNVNEIWDYALSYIRNDSGSIVGYNTYIKEAHPFDFINGTLRISVSTPLIKNMIELRYKDKIEHSVTKITGRPARLEIVVGDIEPIEEKPQPTVENVQKNNSSGLNPRYTFSNYVVGSSNEHAAAVAMSVAKYPGQTNNPLFLYGNSGLGKTHLMHAIGNEIVKNSPEKSVLYVTSERFTIDMINSLRDKKMEDFRKKYRDIDVLLIDDVQFIEGKEGSQEEFFHTFNELYMNNKQIVLTSDRKPRDLVTLEERLRNRFEWGLNIDILTPNYETRMAILKKKAESRNITIDEDVLSYIAERIDSNIRELEGALSKIISYAGISHKEIDIDVADYILRSILPDEDLIKVTPDKIMENVASYYSINVTDITGKSKQKRFALPRQIAMYLCKNMTDLNFTMLARIFGNRDRTTVMYAVDKIAEMAKENAAAKRDIENISKNINN